MGLVCANCGIEINWEPTRVAGKVYCCAGCSQGGPCTCDYEHLPPACAISRGETDVVCLAMPAGNPPEPAADGSAD